jgi:hypothetical protein
LTANVLGLRILASFIIPVSLQAGGDFRDTCGLEGGGAGRHFPYHQLIATDFPIDDGSYLQARIYTQVFSIVIISIDAPQEKEALQAGPGGTGQIRFRNKPRNQRPKQKEATAIIRARVKEVNVVVRSLSTKYRRPSVACRWKSERISASTV